MPGSGGSEEAQDGFPLSPAAFCKCRSTGRQSAFVGAIGRSLPDQPRNICRAVQEGSEADQRLLSDKCEPVSITHTPPWTQAAGSPRHSARAAARVFLSVLRFWRWRSVGTWLWTETCTQANFCNLRMRRNRNISRSRRRNGRCEYSARLLSQCPISWSSPRPNSLSAAPYDRNRSVTMVSGRPCRFMDFFKNSKAA